MRDASRYIPSAVRRFVFHRAKHACENCRKGYPAVLHLHHKIAFIDGGPHTPENLEALCRKCHQLRHDPEAPISTGLAPWAEADELSVAGAALLLQVSLATIYRAAAVGQIPATKVGRNWRFSRATLLRWLAGDRPRLSRSSDG